MSKENVNKKSVEENNKQQEVEEDLNTSEASETATEEHYWEDLEHVESVDENNKQEVEEDSNISEPSETATKEHYWEDLVQAEDVGEKEQSEERSSISEATETITTEEDFPKEVNEISTASQQDSELTENSSSKPTVSDEEKKLKKIFARPRYAEPRHPIFSSPFCRRICVLAFGPQKPKWYRSLSTAELYLFKDLVNYVEVGRSGYFPFDDFMGALQDFDDTITRGEVVELLQGMETSEFEELDFGKFLFLLAYKDKAEEDPENVDETTSGYPITPRQSLILSAISNFALTVSPEEIKRYYIQYTRRKGVVLHHHLEGVRLRGLSEKEMEAKQRNATKRAALDRLYFLTGSPYALPVPFVPSFRNGRLFKEWKRSKYAYKPGPRVSVQWETLPVKRRKAPMDKKTSAHQAEVERIVKGMNFGRIPQPEMLFPAEVHKKLMAGGFTVEVQDQLKKKAEEALNEFRRKLKEAAVLYAQHNLRVILREGFPTKTDNDKFIEIYKRYFPLKVSDVKDYSLWVKPLGYQV